MMPSGNLSQLSISRKRASSFALRVLKAQAQPHCHHQISISRIAGRWYTLSPTSKAARKDKAKAVDEPTVTAIWSGEIVAS